MQATFVREQASFKSQSFFVFIVPIKVSFSKARSIEENKVWLGTKCSDIQVDRHHQG